MKPQLRPVKKAEKRKPRRSSALRLVVGLGNPGPRFDNTRHNVGFDVVRRVASRKNARLKKPLFRRYLWCSSGALILALPLTYMNRSGDVLPGLMRASRTESDDLLVVTDNMDLEPGVVRIKRRGTSRAHNGIASIMDVLGTGTFARLYVGIGRPPGSEQVVDHVLSVPGESELPLYESAVQTAADAVLALEENELDTVMNSVNQRQ